MCINLYTLPKRSIAMLSWNVLTTSRQLLVTQLRFRYMFLSASWEHLDSFVRLLLTILDELFLVLNMFHEFSKVHGPSDRSRIVKKCQVVSRIGYRSRQEVSRHTIRHTSCSNSYKMGKGSGTSSRPSVKMWGSGTSLTRFELENAGLRNELEPFWAWKCGAPERPPTRGAAERAEPRPWEAMNGLKLKKIWKLWSPERQNPPKNVKWWCSGTDFLVICENDMLRNGNSWLKMGVSFAAHTQYAYIWKYPPPPPPGPKIPVWHEAEMWERGGMTKCGMFMERV